MPESYISVPGNRGSVNISENVIAVISAAAIAEVDGVAGFSNSVGTEIYEFLGKKPSSKGIKVSFADGAINVDIAVMVRFGAVISKAASAAQSAVISAIESMTGLTPEVNIHVTGVAFDK